MLKQNASSSQSETGVQLFSRLIANKKSQPQNTNLTKLSQIENKLMLINNLNIDSNIFTNGIDNKSVNEISGKSSIGKSELIMHLISRLILPMKWKINIENESTLLIDLSKYCSSKPHEYVGDSIQKVILIQTECNKLNLMRLFCIIENRLKTLFNEQTSDKYMSPNIESQLKHFIKYKVFKNLVIYNCYSIEQFLLALSACEHFIDYQMTNKNEILPIFIDSLNSNFEVLDRFANKLGLKAINHTENYTVTLLKRLIDRYNICIIATCSIWTQPTSNATSDHIKKYSIEINTSYEKWRSIVDNRLQLYNSSNSENKKTIKLSKYSSNKENSQQDNNFKEENIFYEKHFSIQNIGFTI